MRRHGRILFWFIVAVSAAAGGYIWWDQSRAAAEGQLEENLSHLKEPVAKSPPRVNSLKLQLVRGDVFPLVKTVEQTITQQTDRGPVHSKTKLQLVLAIRVQDVNEGRKRLRVDYRRVQYQQDVAGEKLTYDSAFPPRQIPAEVQAYHGLVNNGFEFWLGPDNRILKLEDFERFLQRCVAHVPRNQRRQVMSRFMKTTGDEGVANFIDDSIGLLPYRKETVRVGDEWVRNRRVLRPVPLYVTQTCKLKKLESEFAVVDITGTVAPTSTYGPAEQPQNGLQLTVRGGRTFGSCRIHSRTGMPQRSEMRQIYDMVVRYPDGRRFNQTKDTHTLIEVFSQQGQPRSIGAASPRQPSLQARR